MPPTAGWGCGIDRLSMLMCGTQNIREVILFPMFRASLISAKKSSQDETKTKKKVKRKHPVREFDDVYKFKDALEEM